MIAVALHDFTDRPEFGHGLGWAVLFTTIALGVGIVWRGAWQRPAPIAGIAATAAFAAAMHSSVDLPSNVSWGLFLLAAAGVAVDMLTLLWPPLVFAGVGLAWPGASLLTTDTGLPAPHWVSTLVVVTVTIGGTLAADFDRRHRDRAWAPALFVVSVVGVYFTVPDTERAMVLLGAALPIAFLGWPFPFASLGAVGAYPCVGALMWVAAVDGRGRLTSVIGAATCLGLFIVEPIAHALRRGLVGLVDALPREWWTAIAVGLGQLALVFGASRIVGMRSKIGQAGLLAVMELTGAVVLLLLFASGDTEDARKGG